jgi:hypothetical protein
VKTHPRQVLTTLDLYLDYPPGEVVGVESVADVGGGMYPVYYSLGDSGLLVSSSVLSLIAHLGGFHRDVAFDPPDFIHAKAWYNRSLQPFFKKNPARRGLAKLACAGTYHVLRLMRDLGGPDVLKPSYPHPVNPWYYSVHTADTRIRKVPPLHLVNTTGEHRVLGQCPTLDNVDDIVGLVAENMKAFIHRLEARFPTHQHVVMTGGWDSQLILLCPKRVPENWHVFSAQPNAPLVRAWLKRNDIEVASFIEDSNENNESDEDTRRKILCTDLYSDIRDIRWLPRMCQIRQEFGGACLFWGGTAADAFFSRHHMFHADLNGWFDLHLTRVASFQGNYHQALFNFVGAPYLSPYHSDEMWRSVVSRLDPAIVCGAVRDLRPLIAEALAGRHIEPAGANPGPPPYTYSMTDSPKTLYLEAAEALGQGTLTWTRNDSGGLELAS